MKKLLIATAALAMVAGTAQAQSSVTVYGVLDIAASNAKSTTSTGVSTEATTTVGTNTNATSVLGLKGTEDLGGGLKAMFDLQGNFNANTGVLGTANASLVTSNQIVAADTNFDRQAWVGLSHDKLGTAKLGRTSDVLDSTEGYANFSQFFDTEAAGANGLGNKNANTIRYDSPLISGITFAAAYSSDAVATAANTSTTGGATVGALSHSGNTTNTYGIQYVQGPLTVGYATGKANVNGSALDGKLSTAYAGYNFGFADVRVQQTIDKAIDQTTATSFREFKTSEISASFPLAMLGSGVSAIVHFEDAELTTQAGRAASGSDYKQMGILVTKALSKRTSIYAGYKDRDVDTGTDVKTVATGVTHSF
jgi:predicted porin